jgi:hypothetical protein
LISNRCLCDPSAIVTLDSIVVEPRNSGETVATVGSALNGIPLAMQGYSLLPAWNPEQGGISASGSDAKSEAWGKIRWT